jgi:hypothetical protein
MFELPLHEKGTLTLNWIKKQNECHIIAFMKLQRNTWNKRQLALNCCQ